jgi:hypothetical protein
LVSGLKANPRTAMRLPSNPPASFSIFGIIDSRCFAFTSIHRVNDPGRG